ncbi:MAG: hypothetical protein E7480_00445 [Ruminococcaceae bacterium]|nr:hypothetical protein [Oscillospiraceae bacterium]
MKKKILILALAVILCVCACLPASARSFAPYNGYEYDDDGNIVPSTLAYTPVSVYQGDVDNTERLINPTDMFIDEENGLIYIVNSGNSSILITDTDFKLKEKITSITDKDGNEITFSQLNGIFVRDELIYLCDTGAAKVYIFNKQKELQRVLEKPKSEIFPQDTEYRPLKVLSDNLGFTYVLCQFITTGALSYDENGEFTGFFGSNTVTVTASMLAERFWRNFMTEDMIEYTVQYVPIEYNSFDVDDENFVYTCTGINQNNVDQIRKINPLGNNIFPTKTYGDRELVWYKNVMQATIMTDIAVNADGFVYGLDSQRGRIFVYDNEGSNLTVFGGSNNQDGTFMQPVAIDTVGDDVYVLDAKASSITTFELTEYGKKLYEGTLLNLDGRYEQAKGIWQQVLMQNANCLSAYYGIGKAEFYTGNYIEAMKNFKLAGERDAESMAFDSLRTEFLREFIGIIISLIVILFILKKVIGIIKRRRKSEN